MWPPNGDIPEIDTDKISLGLALVDGVGCLARVTYFLPGTVVPVGTHLTASVGAAAATQVN